MSSSNLNHSIDHNIGIEELINLHSIGFKLVALGIDNKEIEPWTPIYNNPNYWSVDRLKQEAYKFKNVATVSGMTHLKDDQGRDLFLNCLDIDSDNVYYILFNLENGKTNHRYSFIPKCQQETFVTKTRKKNGFHIYWLSHKQNKSISVDDCKKGYEFEIKTDKRIGHCTLPSSTHRKDVNFCYKNYGQNKIVVSDELYDEVLKLLKDCLKSREESLYQKAINKEPNNNSIEIRLTDEDVQQICEQIWTHYKSGCNCRNNIVFGLAGLCRRYSIAKDSAHKLIEVLAKDDEEQNARLRVLEETYKKNPKEVGGRKKFLAALEHATNNDYVARHIFQRIFGIIMSKRSDEDEQEINYVIALTNEIMREHTFKTMKDTQEIYCFDDEAGVYFKEGESTIQEEVELLYPQINTNQVKEVINHVKRRTFSARDNFDPQI